MAKETILNLYFNINMALLIGLIYHIKLGIATFCILNIIYLLILELEEYFKEKE